MIVRAYTSLHGQGGDLKLLHPGFHVLEVFKVLHLLRLIPSFRGRDRSLDQLPAAELLCKALTDNRLPSQRLEITSIHPRNESPLLGVLRLGLLQDGVGDSSKLRCFPVEGIDILGSSVAQNQW